ncbi:MAG: hypothetical protein AAGC55_19650, partial [Myxococcota bacterium]
MSPRPGLLSLAAIALAALVALGCGSKDKKDPEAPTSPGSAETEKMNSGDDPEDVASPSGDPDGDSDDSGADADDNGDSATASADPEEPAKPEPPKIEPPDLDLSSAEQKEKVNGHLRTAWNALRGADKDPDLAIREARAALAADTTSVDAVVVIAHAYYIKRLYDTAEVVLDMTFKRREEAKQNPGVFYVYGLIYDRTERPEQAMLAYQKAVELAPKYKSALLNLGTHLLRNRSYT